MDIWAWVCEQCRPNKLAPVKMLVYLNTSLYGSDSFTCRLNCFGLQINEPTYGPIVFLNTFFYIVLVIYLDNYYSVLFG